MSAPARNPVAVPRPWSRQRSTLRVTALTPATALHPKILVEDLRKLALRRASASGEPPEALRLHAHHFQPQGLSVWLLLPAMRVVLHTWPEHGLATLDLTGADANELEQWLMEIAAAVGMEPIPSTG